MSGISESNLPGIGRKFQIDTVSGERIVIVIHDDGKREIYHFDRGRFDKPDAVSTLIDGEARQLAGILGGLMYVPKALPSTEIVLEDLVLEWWTLPARAAAAGKSIRDFMVRTKTSASIVSIIREKQPNILNPEADTVLDEGATLIVAGDRNAIARLKTLLTTGSVST